jgi:hypothetical protein
MDTLVDAHDQIAFPGQALNLPGAECRECRSKQHQTDGEDRSFYPITLSFRLLRVSLRVTLPPPSRDCHGMFFIISGLIGIMLVLR